MHTRLSDLPPGPSLREAQLAAWQHYKVNRCCRAEPDPRKSVTYVSGLTVTHVPGRSTVVVPKRQPSECPQETPLHPAA